MAKKITKSELKKLLRERKKLLKELKQREELKKLAEEKKKLEREVWMLKHPGLMKAKSAIAKGGKKLVEIAGTTIAGLQEMQKSGGTKRKRTTGTTKVRIVRVPVTTTRRTTKKKKKRRTSTSYSQPSLFGGVSINPNFFKSFRL